MTRSEEKPVFAAISEFHNAMKQIVSVPKSAIPVKNTEVNPPKKKAKKK